MLTALIADRAGSAYAYLLDVPWAETLRRHASKPQGPNTERPPPGIETASRRIYLSPGWTDSGRTRCRVRRLGLPAAQAAQAALAGSRNSAPAPTSAWLTRMT